MPEKKVQRMDTDDLVVACSDAFWELEGIGQGSVSVSDSGDIQIMRSDKLGYNAPIEVYDNKYYRYADPDYSISEPGLSDNDFGC